MKFIDFNRHIFCLRLKKNIKVFIYDKKESHKVWKWLDDITNYEYHSVCYDNILLTDDKYNCKLVYRKRNGYRLGGIETLFKNQKSNGFYIESINNATERSFTTMYTLVCASILFLTILGCDYSKKQ